MGAVGTIRVDKGHDVKVVVVEEVRCYVVDAIAGHQLEGDVLDDLRYISREPVTGCSPKLPSP